MEGVYSYKKSDLSKLVNGATADIHPLSGGEAGSDTFSAKQITEFIKDQKYNIRILSLCKHYDNMLMWSHYGDAHRGFVLGCEIESDDVYKSDVKYRNSLSLFSSAKELKKFQNSLTSPNNDFFKKHSHYNELPTRLAIHILTRKYTFWRYEKEFRVFAFADEEETRFIKVKPTKLIFGYRTSRNYPENVEALTSIAKSKKIEVITIDKESLQLGIKELAV